MRSLQSINYAREEARYVSRTWGNTPSAPDVPWEPVYSVPVESPDDIILVCRPDPTTISGERGVEMTRRQYEENKEQYQAELRAVRKGKL
jgi:hypothetical protein